MDIKRTVLWAIFFVSAIMLFDNWQREHGRPSMFFPNPEATRPAAGTAPGSSASASQGRRERGALGGRLGTGRSGRAAAGSSPTDRLQHGRL